MQPTRGFSSLILLLVIALVIGGGYYYFTHATNTSSVTTLTQATSTLPTTHSYTESELIKTVNTGIALSSGQPCIDESSDLKLYISNTLYYQSASIHNAVCAAIADKGTHLLQNVIITSSPQASPYFHGYATVTLLDKTYLVAFLLSLNQSHTFDFFINQTALLTNASSLSSLTQDETDHRLVLIGKDLANNSFTRYLQIEIDEGADPIFEPVGIYLQKNG